jgi:hypothetical protein
VTYTSAAATFPIWSPDGTSIAFFDHAARNGLQGWEFIVRRNGSGTWGEPVQTRFPGGINSVTWLPDGRFAFARAGSIVLASSQSDEGEVIYDHLKSGGPLVEGIRIMPGDASKLYLKSHDAEGRASFWSIPTSGGRPTHLFSLDDLSRPSILNSFAVGAGQVFFPIDERRGLIWVAEVID